MDGTYTPSPVVANGTVANGGGASVVAKYQLSAFEYGVGGNGWEAVLGVD